MSDGDWMGENRQRTLLAAERRTIHGLTHHSQHNANCVFNSDVVLVLLLQQALGSTFAEPE